MMRRMLNAYSRKLGCSIAWTIFLLGCCIAVPQAGYGRDYLVTDYGAKADGLTLDTKAVQAAIDRCHGDGGGTVIVPAGHTVLIGTIYLKDFVALRVEMGGVLLGSNNIADYATDTHKTMYKDEPHMNRCLIFAQSAKHIAIKGNGTIDGNGFFKNFTAKTGRPMLIRFLACEDIRVNDITLINPASWTSSWLYCNRITVSGIKIVSRVNNNGDGLDFDGCSDVRVTNSSFDTSDDSICLQTSQPDKPCRNIVISNCTFTSKWAGIRIGLLSRGDFESVAVSNCTFTDISDSGLKIQMNEGGEMKNMIFSNLIMKNVPRPVFMTFCQQRAYVDAPVEMPPMKAMHHFNFNNFIVDNRELDQNAGFVFTGMPGHTIDHITLSNIQFVVAGGGTEEEANRAEINELTLPVLGNWWPEFKLLGTLPAFGIYARHVKGLYASDIQVQTIAADRRMAVVLDDVSMATFSNSYANGRPITPKIINK
ncbi:glycosyl hydrolase family 28 [Dyadobacter jejuensis]|uniref:Glycosyl hydrolase family 28 n=1 Tax=Dyadobacter jejuensis TaxID=1082580 RepID=A0A316ALU4_9BACT|nr:glycosyl hydrolase family 28 protein [Dyadobacter jejuensis]PWJ58034.1 glycosyl hydrolase family 28 [Dyadobacter jejuensis]